jgi:hypothetical protein
MIWEQIPAGIIRKIALSRHEAHRLILDPARLRAFVVDD